MDVGPIGSGLAFNGYDKETKQPLFNRVESLNVYNLELTGDIKVTISSWNISIHKWLKYYVFLQLIDRSKKTLQFMPAIMTFMVSAVWHGFYPGLFIFFIAAALLELIAKMAQKTIIVDLFPPFLSHKLSFIWLEANKAYYGVCFMLLSLDKIRIVHGSFYYIGEILLIIQFVVLKSGILNKPKTL
mmetsp:Transcript_46259/g.62838  ORF Transcript_46259/g.62838 Transcript_46259/m.62838 type:complete len:186 (+) Transcript_46259:578-1135(+)